MINTKYVIFLGLILFSLIHSSSASILIDETFDNTQNLPSSMKWWNGSSSGSLLTTEEGQMNISTASSSSLSLAYFTTSGSPASLSSGESATVSFTFSAANIANVALGLRFGLFNSSSSRVSSNGFGVSSTTFNGYAGYGFMSDLGYTSSSESYLFHRDAGLSSSSPSADNLMGSGYPSAISGTSFAGLSLLSDSSHTISFTVANNGSSSAISIFLDGSLLKTYTDSTYHYTSFDTIAFQFTGGTASAITLTDLTVTYSTIPESAHLFLIAFGGLGIMTFLRRPSLSKAA